MNIIQIIVPEPDLLLVYTEYLLVITGPGCPTRNTTDGSSPLLYAAVFEVDRYIVVGRGQVVPQPDDHVLA